MSKTLAELRSAPRAARAERTISLCLAPDLVAEVQELIEQMEALPVAAARSAPTGDDGPPLRMGESTEPEADPAEERIKARMREVLDEMAEYDGELRVRAIDDGDWRRWVNAHPARQDDRPAEQQRDREVAKGYCDADALIEDLAKYALSWNGDPLGPDDWANVIEPNLTNPDKKKIAQAVVGMHEQVQDLGKWAWGLSETLRSAADADALERPASPPPSTSDESPQSGTSTTTPTTN